MGSGASISLPIAGKRFRSHRVAAIAPEPSDPALLRTTTEAEALVNFRLLTGETAAGVTAYIRTVMKDAAIRIEVLPHSGEASPVSMGRMSAFPWQITSK